MGSSTPSPDSEQQQFQIWLVDIGELPILRPFKSKIAIRQMWGTEVFCSYLEYRIVLGTGLFWARLILLNPFGLCILKPRFEVLSDDLVLDLDVEGVGHLN